MKKQDNPNNMFGKKSKDVYKIIEREYANGDVRFFILIECRTDFGFELYDDFILDETFATIGEATVRVDELKEFNKKFNVIDEKIHEV